MTYVKQTLQSRFERKFIPEPMSGCFLWLGVANDRGYGKFTWRGKRRNARHIALELAGRSVPEGLIACHHCDNPWCVNPDHLFVGTHLDNTLDMMRKGRGKFPGCPGPRKTHCVRGHLRDESNLYRDPDGRGHCLQCRVSRRAERLAGQ